MQNTKSAISRWVRVGKRSVLVALFGLLVTSAAVPATSLAKSLPNPSPHIVHTADGQGDSPLVP
jgi:hypothetical protein